MTIHSLERPDTMPELAIWLERQLVGDTLSDLVAELKAVTTSPPQPPLELDQLLGDVFNSVLNSGLKAIPEAMLRQLFRYPDRLLELQEHVLVDGGDYWNHVERPESLIVASNVTFEKLKSKIGSGSNGLDRLTRTENSDRTQSSSKSQHRHDQDVVMPTQPGRSAAKPDDPRSTTRRMWLASVAAVFFIGVTLGWLLTSTDRNGKGMAWTKPNALKPAKDRVEFLTRLASLANEWFDERPSNADALEKRIREFRRGCSLLISSENAIPPEDRKWLLESCRKWSDKLDGQLAELKKGGDVGRVQADTDLIIKTLINKLTEMAKV